MRLITQRVNAPRRLQVLCPGRIPDMQTGGQGIIADMQVECQGIMPDCVEFIHLALGLHGGPAASLADAVQHGTLGAIAIPGPDPEGLWVGTKIAGLFHAAKLKSPLNMALLHPHGTKPALYMCIPDMVTQKSSPKRSKIRVSVV